MPEQTESRFGLNLLTQFILACAFSIGAGFVYGDGTLGVVLSAIGSILWLTFSFGFLYGIFRLVGVRAPGLESFYQSFPFGLSKASMKRAEEEWPPKKNVVSEPFDWHKLFSFQYLRFVGVLLIITSVFSLLFNIEWELLYKIIAAAVSGLLLLGGAEWLMRIKKGSIAPFCAILAFALLHFALSLTYKYSLLQQWPDIWMMGDTWMYLKIALTIVLIFTLKRYPAVWFPLLYVFVGYFTPMSLQYVGASFSPTASAVFIVAMTIITLVSGNLLKRSDLIVANAILANVCINWLLLPEAFNMRYLVLSFVIGMFAAQLLASVIASAKDPKDPTLHSTNAIISHVMLAVGIILIRSFFPWIDTYIGVTFLLLANISLIAYLLGKKLGSNGTFIDVLFNIAVIMASIGLFIQVEGPWSAVIFLAYSTAVLWLSLYRRNIRTRIYGCVLLLVSIIKLYFEFSGIFDRIWGCVAILAIGLLLVVLSYKFEAIKDVMLHGMKDTKA